MATTIELPMTTEWTPELLERLPPDFRYEVSEGRLVVGWSAKSPRHAEHQARLCDLLRSRGRLAYREQGVVIGPGEILTCDVGVFRRSPTADVAYHLVLEAESAA